MPPDPTTLPPPVGEFVQVNNLPTMNLPGVGATVREALDRTHRFSADGTVVVTLNQSGKEHWRGQWRFDGKFFELGEQGRNGLRGYYYGDEIRLTPGAFEDPQAALIVLRRK